MGTVATKAAEAGLQGIFKGQWVHVWQIFTVLEKMFGKKGKSQFAKEPYIPINVYGLLKVEGSCMKVLFGICCHFFQK